MTAEIDVTIKDLKDAEWECLPHSIQLANLALLRKDGSWRTTMNECKLNHAVPPITAAVPHGASLLEHVTSPDTC